MSTSKNISLDTPSSAKPSSPTLNTFSFDLNKTILSQVLLSASTRSEPTQLNSVNSSLQVSLPTVQTSLATTLSTTIASKRNPNYVLTSWNPFQRKSRWSFEAMSHSRPQQSQQTPSTCTRLLKQRSLALQASELLLTNSCNCSRSSKLVLSLSTKILWSSMVILFKHYSTPTILVILSSTTSSSSPSLMGSLPLPSSTQSTESIPKPRQDKSQSIKTLFLPWPPTISTSVPSATPFQLSSLLDQLSLLPSNHHLLALCARNHSNLSFPKSLAVPSNTVTNATRNEKTRFTLKYPLLYQLLRLLLLLLLNKSSKHKLTLSRLRPLCLLHNLVTT